MQDDDLTEAVKQAAREAVAKELDAVYGKCTSVDEVRAGSADDSIEVHNAILGALAAVPVVREMVRAEAAERERDALLAVARAARAFAETPKMDVQREFDAMVAAIDALPPEVRAKLDQSE